jgi:ethanolaminephosphotransferase
MYNLRSKCRSLNTGVVCFKARPTFAGVMHYGNGLFGILEANYGLATVHFISGTLGPEIWQRKLRSLHARIPAQVQELTVMDVTFYLALTFMGIQIVGQIARVFGGKHTMDAKERGHKKLGYLTALQHLLYVFSMYCLCYLFLMQPIYDEPFYCRAVLLTVLVVYTSFATHLIVCHMAKEPFSPNIVVPVVVMAAVVLNWVTDLLDPVPLTYIAFAVCLLLYIHYVVNVCDQVCKFLGIKCLTIPIRMRE